MSNVIQIKRGQSAPPNGTLYPGELGINMTSGVLYIGSNKTDANGKYISTFPYAYRLRSAAGIQTTEEQEEGQPDFGPYMSFRFLNSQEQTRGSIMITSKNRINLNCQVTGSNYADRYLLPEPTNDLTEDKWYNILTSKNVVTVAQGGTGQTSLTSGHVLIGNSTGAVASRAIKNNTTIGNCDWSNATGTANGTNLITLNTLAFWNGRYNSTSSNLAYCAKGAFGEAAIKNVTIPNLNPDYVENGSESKYITGPIYGSSDELLVNARTLRWWNGQHSDGASNLAYCNKGAFGTFATKDASTFLQTAGNTVSKIVLKGTTSQSNAFGDDNPKICFYNGSSQQGVSLTYSDQDNIQNPASLTLNGQQGGEYFIAPFVKTILVTTSYGTGDPSGSGVAGQVYFKVV